MVEANGYRLQRYAQVARVFTPGAPVDQLSLFAGRIDQIKDVVNALGQRGHHVVIYGERGVGKTSLANVLEDIFEDLFDGFPESDLRFVKINCGTNDDFAGLWKNALRELRITDLDESPRMPEDVRYVLSELASQTVIVIDELDRLEDDEALSLLADTIKSLSDHSVRTTLVLVGVADSIDHLIGDHASIERALIQVQMPRMSEAELAEILDRGCDRLGMTIALPARARIARLSEGLPHYTHLLGLHAAQRAVMDDRMDIQWEDVTEATDLAVKKAKHSIRNAYQLATRSPQKDNLFPQVLLACALAPKGDLGYFPASAVREPMSAIMGKKYDIPAFARHLNAFTSDDRAAVLQKSGAKKRYFYRFENPLLQPFVIMKGLADGLTTDTMLREVQKHERTEPDAEAEESEADTSTTEDSEPSEPQPLF